MQGYTEKKLARVFLEIAPYLKFSSSLHEGT